jgi:hypothetical protein
MVNIIDLVDEVVVTNILASTQALDFGEQRLNRISNSLFTVTHIGVEANLELQVQRSSYIFGRPLAYTRSAEDVTFPLMCQASNSAAFLATNACIGAVGCTSLSQRYSSARTPHEGSRVSGVGVPL